MAGFWAGFGEQFSTDFAKRQDKLDTLIKENLANARRTAPKYAEVKAKASNSADIMREMQSEFDVTPEEFIALAQNYDINAVYNTIQKTKAQLPEGETLSKSEFLGSLKIPEGATLPEGMTPEQALESIYFGYARNLNKQPGNKSESHRTGSWSKAIKDTLMLNPNASAEEQIETMKVMGVPVQELLQFEASMGSDYDPLQGVERVGGFDIATTDYKENDYRSTASTYERAFTRTFAGTDDLANVTNMEEALNAIGAKDKSDLGNRLRKGGTAIADLELGLSQSGMKSKLARDQVLLKLSNEVNTAGEMDNLLSAVDDGKAQELIMESIQKNGRLTNEYIEYILTGTMPQEGEASAIAPESSIRPMMRPDNLGGTGTVTDTGSATDTGTVTDTGNATVAAILNNASDEEPDEVSTTGAAATAALNIENAEKRAASVSDITYSDWKKLSRQERKDKGYPVRNIDALYTDPDAWKPEPEDTSGESKPVLSTLDFINKYKKELIEFINENETDTTDKEDIKSTLAAWFSDNAENLEISGTMGVEELTNLMHKALNR